MSSGKIKGVAGTVLRNGARPNSSRRLPAYTASAGTFDLEKEHLASLRVTFAAEIEAIKAEAFEQGLAEGRAKAAKLMERERLSQEQILNDQSVALTEKAKALGDQLQALLSELEAKSEQAFTSMEPLVVRLAYAGLVKMLGEEWPNRSLLADLVNNAVRAYKLKQPYTICISPRDYKLLAEQALPDEVVGQFESDAGLTPGSCVFHFDTHELDFDIEHQLAVLRRVLMGETDNV